jgi:hypothetical protein
MSEQIDIGDHVHHGPSNEDWVVAKVTETHLWPAGWPPCRAELSDCTLVKKVSQENKVQMIQDLMRLPSDDERHVSSHSPEAKWRWKMDYCKSKNIPPAQQAAWDEAEQAYEAHLRASADGPEAPDGHDCEGFKGGCERMGCPGGEDCEAAPKKEPQAPSAGADRKTSNVVPFIQKNAAKDPDVVLEQAIGDYQSVVIIGWDKNGKLDPRASLDLTQRDIHWMLSVFQQKMLNGDYSKDK